MAYEDDLNRMVSRSDAAYDDLIEQGRARLDAAIAPIDAEIETLKTKREFRNPLQDVAGKSAAHGQTSAAAAKGAQASGLGGAASFAMGAMAQQAASDIVTDIGAAKQREKQLNIQAIKELVQSRGSMQTQGEIAIMQTGSAGLQAALDAQSRVLAARMEAQARSKGAGFGAIGGVLGSFVGSDWFGDWLNKKPDTGGTS